VGRDEDFAEFASARWLTLARSAVLLGAGHHEAEDLAQTSLMRCYVSWSKVTSAAHQDAYVMRMLLNEFSRSRRRRWWGERPTSRPTSRLPETAEPDPTTRIDGADAVARALARLGKGQREVVVLRYFVHLTERQTAEALGVPEGTVKSRLSRAYQQLAAGDLQALRDGTMP
jgi:RNA polymerase sigma-70 factor (sigma-E family)